MAAERQPSYNQAQEQLGRGAEVILIPEVEYRLNFAVITISGKGSSGNTSFATGIAEKYGVPQDRVFYAGRFLRKLKSAGESIDYIPRDLDDDIHINQEVVNHIKSASIENPVIIEAKLGGVISRYLEQLSLETGEVYPSPRFSILKSADPNKRARIAQSKEKYQGYSLKDLKKINANRDKLDLIQWNAAGDEVRRFKDILNKNARDLENRPLYDLLVDSTDRNLEEDIAYTHKLFVARGVVKKNHS